MTKKRKTWREKLHNDQELPKVVNISDTMSKRWRTGTCIIPAPREVDAIMHLIPRKTRHHQSNPGSPCHQLLNHYRLSHHHRYFFLGGCPCCRRSQRGRRRRPHTVLADVENWRNRQ
ncbi:MAG: hypothetical protein NTX88_06255 [Candidatus Atribacteria bacterium]|nr:hypothetical protein [Candidatus Atribacteria bacterium]